MNSQKNEYQDRDFDDIPCDFDRFGKIFSSSNDSFSRGSPTPPSPEAAETPKGVSPNLDHIQETVSVEDSCCASEQVSEVSELKDSMNTDPEVIEVAMDRDLDHLVPEATSEFFKSGTLQSEEEASIEIQPIHPPATPFKYISSDEEEDEKEFTQNYPHSEGSEMSETECRQISGYIDRFVDIKESLAEENKGVIYDLKSKQMELYHLKVQNKKLETDMKNLEQEFSIANHQKEQAKAQLIESEQRHSDEITALEAKISDLKKVETNQSQLLQEKSAEISKLTLNLQKILKEKEEISEDLDLEREARIILNDEFQEANQKLEACYDEKSRLKKDLNAIQEERVSLLSELKKYKSQCAKLQTELDSRKKISDTVQKYNKQILELRSSKDVLKAALDHKTQEYIDLKKQYEILQKRKIVRNNTMEAPAAGKIDRFSILSQKSITSWKDESMDSKNERILQKHLEKERSDNKKKSEIIDDLNQQLLSNKKHLKNTEKRLQESNKERKEECRKLKVEIQKCSFKNRKLRKKLDMIIETHGNHREETGTFGDQKGAMEVEGHVERSMREPYVSISDSKPKKKKAFKHSENKNLLKRTPFKDEIMKEIRNANVKLDEITKKILKRGNKTKREKQKHRIDEVRSKEIVQEGPYKYITPQKDHICYKRPQMYTEAKKKIKFTPYSVSKSNLNCTDVDIVPAGHHSPLRVKPYKMIGRNGNLRSSRSFSKLHY
ncbi:unnamed protein product [Moneuplotes crassus]|uniref:Uncharacterized protein n=1 Tax=Euplotes crassus TaxID=5936 RepID=A0AAD2DB98_EUPCR|nr:unnamed protein product [Moneuplotes crassus]